MVFTPMTLLEIFRAGLVLHSLECFNVSIRMVFHSSTMFNLRVTAYRLYLPASNTLPAHHLSAIVYIITITRGQNTAFSSITGTDFPKPVAIRLS